MRETIIIIFNFNLKIKYKRRDAIEGRSYILLERKTEKIKPNVIVKRLCLKKKKKKHAIAAKKCLANKYNHDMST